MTGAGPASEAVRAAIDSAGPLRFDRYVELCLYDPEVGFFGRGGGAGRQGRDFLTSPEVGPLFGAVLSRVIDHWWVRLGRPRPFTVVDAGAGRGTLARTIRAAEPACRVDLELVLVETSPALRAEHPDGVRSVAELPEHLGVGLVVANELLDNLAPRVLERTAHGWSELHVGLDDHRNGEGLVEVLVPMEEPGPDVAAVPGRRVPMQSRAAAWVEAARSSLDRGAVIALDYTATTAELAGRPWSQWLRTYAGHQRGSDPLDRPGTQDLTGDVCIDQLPAPTTTSTQAEFLRAYGLDALVAEGRAIWAERAHLGDLEAMVARSRIAEAEALVEPSGLGSFTVLEWVVPDVGTPTIRP